MDVNDVMHWKCTQRILGIWKKSVEFQGRRKTVEFWARPEALWRVPHEMEDRWKSQNRKNVYLSPYVEEPLNSKVIKSFVPELRSHKCFSRFGIPMFYVYMLLTFYVHFPYSCMVFVAASHQTRFDTRSKARRPIKVGIKGRRRSGTSLDSNPAGLCCSSTH